MGIVELRLKKGMPLAEVAIDASAAPFRLKVLTAAAMVRASVILFDPIFQGLAISLMAGEIASLLPSRMAAPVLCYLASVEGASRLRRWVIFRNLGIRLWKITLALRPIKEV